MAPLSSRCICSQAIEYHSTSGDSSSPSFPILTLISHIISSAVLSSWLSHLQSRPPSLGSHKLPKRFQLNVPAFRRHPAANGTAWNTFSTARTTPTNIVKPDSHHNISNTTYPGTIHWNDSSERLSLAYAQHGVPDGNVLGQ